MARPSGTGRCAVQPTSSMTATRRARTAGDSVTISSIQADQKTAGDARTAFTGAPQSIAIIEAGATAASKGWAAAISALGGATAVWAAVSHFWESQPAVQGTLIVGAAVVIAACALGAALIMYGDVQARGQAAAAQYPARASVAAAFLSGARCDHQHPLPSGSSVVGSTMSAPNVEKDGDSFRELVQDPRAR